MSEPIAISREGPVMRVCLDWPNAEAKVLDSVLSLSAANYEAMTVRTRQSDRDADMAALVRSAACGSIKQRIAAYRSTLSSKKPEKR